MSLDQPSTKVSSSKNPSGGAVAAKTAKIGEGSKRHPRSMRVLIVDDHEEAADTLCATVTSWGHDVRRFYDGANGLAGARAQIPNVALVDISMPGMDGYEMARQLRLRSELHGCYVIAMRASDDLRDVPRMEASIDLFLAKPMNLSVLETLLLMEGERLDRLA